MSEIESPSLDAALVRTLSAAVDGDIQLNLPLKSISRWEIGGPASAYVVANSRTQISDVLKIMRERSEPMLIVGETSNLLFDSAGFAGIVLRLGDSFSTVHIDGARIEAGAAANVPALADAAALAGLTGIEHVAGIPGTLGGLVAMNGGTQRRGIGENVTSVDVVDASGDMHTVTSEEAGFSYRNSAFQGDRNVILGASLLLEPGDRDSIQATIASIRSERSRKFPSDTPNCGSTFLSDPAMYSVIGPPGKAIEDAGLKGLRRGGAVISNQHANFINNTGGATSDDVLWLIESARTTVFERTGFDMPCEVKFVSHNGEIQPAHIGAASRWAGQPTRESR